MPKSIKRCHWPTPGDDLYIKYHDHEWGVPVYDDLKIFEFLILESFQAGLSWRTVLHKRKAFEKAFAKFNPLKISKFGAAKHKQLMNDAGIIRNKLKIEAAVNNAKLFLEIKKEFGSFSKYMWSWVGGKTINNKIKTPKDYQVFNKEAIAWAKDLKRRGFKFLGPTVVYAHMQATGMVNDHITSCFRHNQVKLFKAK